jgi:4-amino-4-deoxychorismate lyase
MGMILLNGEMLEDEKVILDSGFTFGRGLFETMLVRDEPLFLKEHLERINRGLPLIGIGKTISEKEVLDAAAKLGCRDKVLKMVVTEKNTLFTTRENRYIRENYIRGFRIKMSAVRRNESSPLTYLKSLNYLDNIIEHEKCEAEGYDEVLFLNGRDELCEGSVSNVFFIKGDRIFTPAVSCGLLGGTVRKFVIDCFDVTEGRFGIEDLHNADAVFVTNSVMGIMKAAEIGCRYYHENDIFKEIKSEYDSKTI